MQLQEILSSMEYFANQHSYKPFPVIDGFSQTSDEKDDLFPKTRIKGLKYFEDCIRTDVRMLQLVRHTASIEKGSIDCRTVIQ